MQPNKQKSRYQKLNSYPTLALWDVVLLKHADLSWTEQRSCSLRGENVGDCTKINDTRTVLSNSKHSAVHRECGEVSHNSFFFPRCSRSDSDTFRP